MRVGKKERRVARLTPSFLASLRFISLPLSLSSHTLTFRQTEYLLLASDRLHYRFLLSLIFIASSTAIMVSSCLPSRLTTAPSQVREIQDKVLIVDVREPEELTVSQCYMKGYPKTTFYFSRDTCRSAPSLCRT
jgi:hypothetical protein